MTRRTAKKEGGKEQRPNRIEHGMEGGTKEVLGDGAD